MPDKLKLTEDEYRVLKAAAEAKELEPTKVVPSAYSLGLDSDSADDVMRRLKTQGLAKWLRQPKVYGDSSRRNGVIRPTDEGYKALRYNNWWRRNATLVRKSLPSLFWIVATAALSATITAYITNLMTDCP